MFINIGQRCNGLPLVGTRTRLEIIDDTGTAINTLVIESFITLIIKVLIDSDRGFSSGILEFCTSSRALCLGMKTNTAGGSPSQKQKQRIDP
jgi:hypothetical protein